MLFYSYIFLSSLNILSSVSSELQSHTNRSDYYKCLFTKEPIVCEYGEICRLRSSSHCESWNRTAKERPTTSFWYRQDGIQRKVFDDEQTLTDSKTGDLIFFQVTHNEQGAYAEWRPIANSTGSYWKDPTCGEIHLTVVTDNDNYRYPLYYENSLGVVVNDDDISKDSGQLIVWSEWNECQCTGLEYRFRTGDCILTKPLDSKYPHLNGIFKQYSNRIPCFSSLLPVNYRFI